MATRYVNKDKVEELVRLASAPTRELRQTIERLNRELEAAKGGLQQLERSCKHEFYETIYTPIMTDGYKIDGDPPGVGGVDRRFDTYVADTTDKVWTRVCKKCAKVEKTTQTRKQVVAGSIAGTTAEIQIPDFGDKR